MLHDTGERRRGHGTWTHPNSLNGGHLSILMKECFIWNPL